MYINLRKNTPINRKYNINELKETNLNIYNSSGSSLVGTLGFFSCLICSAYS